MNEPYVLVVPWRFPDPILNEVILLEKEKPTWMKGMLNLPGGKVEGGETPVEAAVRELREETGLESMEPIEVGSFPGVMKVVVCRYMGQTPKQMESEKLHVLSLLEALKHPKLMPNLRLILPLVISKQTGWKIWGAFVAGGQKARLQVEI